VAKRACERSRLVPATEAEGLTVHCENGL